MKVLICGDRDWTDRNKIALRMKKIPRGSVVITGGARGADTIAYGEAIKLQLKNFRIKAAWKKYGKAAGPIRNRKMLSYKPDLVIAFHENMALSLGTKDCVTQAVALGIPVEVIT